MKNSSFSSLRPLDWLRYFVARLGWPGTLGLALLVSAWLVHGLDVQPRIDAGIEMEQRAERLSKQARPVREAEATRSVALSETLPGAERIPEAVARLFAAATHAGLSLKQGVYRPAGEKSSGMMRYQISLPVTGNYPAIRAFVAEALERERSLALDGIRLARTRMDSDEIEAELRFTLFLGAAR
ncbi:MAG: hypothetical protein B7Y41_09870 [Hydrogenophilales bacterium 28-61-23]|nr:MAG: hypothetical protein B7Y41_09870 [Hydrogenophilales bacterium 28-61-23]